MDLHTLKRELDGVEKEVVKAVTPNYLRALAERCDRLRNIEPMDAYENELRLMQLRADDIATRAWAKRRDLLPEGG